MTLSSEGIKSHAKEIFFLNLITPTARLETKVNGNHYSSFGPRSPTTPAQKMNNAKRLWLIKLFLLISPPHFRSTAIWQGKLQSLNSMPWIYLLEVLSGSDSGRSRWISSHGTKSYSSRFLVLESYLSAMPSGNIIFSSAKSSPSCPDHLHCSF